MYNKAEVVVVPSEKMYQRLVEEGLTVKKYVVQKMWDFNVHMDLHTPSFEKKTLFSRRCFKISFFPELAI